MMQQPKRRKKRPIQGGGLKLVEVTRGKNGYGFTISGQQPCVLSCIVNSSPADRAGLRTGDFLISVNGMNVSDAPHDDVVRLIGSSSGMLTLQIAETVHSSDSSDNDLHAKPSKVKYPPRRHRHGKAIGRSMEELGVHDLRRVAEPITNKYGHVVPRGRREESFEHVKVRAISPGRELERHYGYEDQRHYRSLGVENMDPFIMEHHSRRTRHVSAHGPLSSKAHRASRHTKHTIITREHRLGLAKSLGHSDGYGTLPKVGPHGSHSHLGTHIHHGRDLSSSSSSSNNTYMVMNQEPRVRHRESQRGHIPQNNQHYDHQMHSEILEEEDSSDLIDIPGNLRVIVGYVGSVEMPRDSRVNARLQSIRSAVRRLQVERKIHTMVLMVISLEGVTLVNTLGNTMAVYPCDKVAFSGVNPDDKRFFGIVTFHGYIEDSSGVETDTLSGGACHVFMVDPDLSVHTLHVNKAKNFGIQCTLNEETQKCMEFPKSATIIVKCISRLYQDRSSSGLYENGMAHLSAFEQPLNRMSSRPDGSMPNPDSSIGSVGTRDRSSPALPRVCVVDVPSSSGETPSPVTQNNSQQNLSQQLESSGSTTLKSESSMRWGLSSDNSSIKTPNNDPSNITDNQSIGHGADISQSNNSQNISGMSAISQDPGVQNSSLDSKLNVRAMPNPKGFPALNEKSDSWNDLLADQNSADNLRRSMQRFLQTRTKPFESGSDIDSIVSQDSNQASPPQSNIFTSPVPPLPPRSMMRNPSGSSLGYTEQSGPNPVVANYPGTTNTKQKTQAIDDPVEPVEKPEERTGTESQANHPQKVSQPQQSSQAPSQPIATVKTIKHPTSKPPLPDNARTPARPMRPPIERPKSTPPIRTPGAELPMDVEEDEYDSDPGNLSTFVDSTDNKDSWGSNTGVSSEVVKPQPVKSFWGKTGLFRSKDSKKEKEKTPSKGIKKSGSFKQRGFRTPKLQHHYQSAHPSRSGSIESLVVNNADIPGDKHVGGATSVTVITQNGVISYQENGTNAVGRAAGWAVNFERLLRDKAGLAAFTEFLKKEFSEENIIFWKKCEDYRKLATAKERKTTAQEIYKTHIDCDAAEPVNIDGAAKTATLQGLETASQDLFDLPKKQIFQLMKQDSYTRFLKSEIYKDCVKSEIDHRPLPYDDVDSVQTNGHAGGGKDDIRRPKEEKKSLKKSSSSTEEGGTEKRRRSLLPWGKKDRLAKLMPKVMTDSDLRKSSGKKEERYNNNSLGKMSLDLADLNALNKEFKNIEDNSPRVSENSTSNAAPPTAKEVSQKFCRVVFPDGSTTVFYAKPGQSVRTVLTKLCEKRHLDVDLVDVYNTSADKIVSLQTDASQIGSKEIKLEMRILFRIDLPNKKCLGLRARPGKTLQQVLSPIMLKYGHKLENFVLHQVGSNETINLETKVSEVNRKRIACFSAAEFQVKRKKSKEWGGITRYNKPPLPRMASEPAKLGNVVSADDAQTRLFQCLFEGDTQLLAQIDEDGVFDPDTEKEENKSAKADQESRVSGLFSNILRKNSMDGKEGGVNNNNKTKRVQKSNSKPERQVSITSDKNKADIREDLKVFSLLTKFSGQFDDQRGPLRPQDLELPDFLKPKSRSNLSGEFPLRRTDMHNSDTSLYEPPHTEERELLEKSRKLSNSEENLDNIAKQLRRSSRSKSSGFSLHALHAANATPAGKIPYMDMSFSHDGVVPSHLEAEDYFSVQTRSASPDFTDPRLMEKSLKDIGMHPENNNGQMKSGKSKHFKMPATPQEKSHKDANEKPITPTPAPRKGYPAVPKRRRPAIRKFSDVDSNSTCSEMSDITSSERNSVNSEDLNNTLLPPSVSTSDASDDQYSSSVHYNKNSKLYTSSSGHILSPKRPIRVSSKSSSKSSGGSEKLQRKQYKQEKWASSLYKQSSDSSMDIKIASANVQSSRSESPNSSAEMDIGLGSSEYGASRSTTPSPTTHDLVLLAESSPDEQQQSAQQKLHQRPTPQKRNSLLQKQRSLDNILEKRGERVIEDKSDRTGGSSFSDINLEEIGDDVQVSYV